MIPIQSIYHRQREEKTERKKSADFQHFFFFVFIFVVWIVVIGQRSSIEDGKQLPANGIQFNLSSI